jgi:hypothetical protein
LPTDATAGVCGVAAGGGGDGGGLGCATGAGASRCGAGGGLLGDRDSFWFVRWGSSTGGGGSWEMVTGSDSSTATGGVSMTAASTAGESTESRTGTILVMLQSSVAAIASNPLSRAGQVQAQFTAEQGFAAADFSGEHQGTLSGLYAV